MRIVCPAAALAHATTETELYYAQARATDLRQRLLLTYMIDRIFRFIFISFIMSSCECEVDAGLESICRVSREQSTRRCDLHCLVLSAFIVNHLVDRRLRTVSNASTEVDQYLVDRF